MNVFDVCAQIGMDAGPRGKKCPGGYSIPVNKQCGKGGAGRMRSPGAGNNLNRWRLAGAVALGGVAMHQAEKIRRQREARKAGVLQKEDVR